MSNLRSALRRKRRIAIFVEYEGLPGVAHVVIGDGETLRMRPTIQILESETS